MSSNNYQGIICREEKVLVTFFEIEATIRSLLLFSESYPRNARRIVAQYSKLPLEIRFPALERYLRKISYPYSYRDPEFRLISLELCYCFKDDRIVITARIFRGLKDSREYQPLIIVEENGDIYNIYNRIKELVIEESGNNRRRNGRRLVRLYTLEELRNLWNRVLNTVLGTCPIL